MLRKKYVCLRWGAYIERLISDILIIKLVHLVVGDVRVALVYLQLNPNRENNKYVENKFVLPGPLK